MINRFKDGDRVAFVGDSITQHGFYIAYLRQFYETNFPKEKITFINCGIGGARTQIGLDFFEQDVNITKPNIIFLMYGMNDSEREIILSKDEKLIKKALDEAFEKFKKNIPLLVEKASKLTNNIVLMSTPIYDEFNGGGETPIPSAYKLIKKYADFMKYFAVENGYPFIDVFKATDEASKLYKDAISSDHVHPTQKGHYFIAKEILKEQGFSLENQNLDDKYLDWNKAYGKYRDFFVLEYLFNLSNISPKDKLEIIEKYEFKNGDPSYYPAIVENYIKNAKNRLAILDKLLK